MWDEVLPFFIHRIIKRQEGRSSEAAFVGFFFLFLACFFPCRLIVTYMHVLCLGDEIHSTFYINFIKMRFEIKSQGILKWVKLSDVRFLKKFKIVTEFVILILFIN